MERLTDTIWLHEVKLGFSVTTAVVRTPLRTFVFDTATGPQEMAPVNELLAEVAGDVPVLVVNSHHHWDHVYGNAAFPGRDIVAHRACRRLMAVQNDSVSEAVPSPPSEGVPPPTLGFGDRLVFEDGSETIHLVHTPGHTEDSLVMYLDNAQVLLGGDTVEWPLPSLAQRDGEEIFIKTLRQLKQLPILKVVPSHGPVMGKEIIDANQRYIETLYEAVRAARDKGVARHDLALPAEWFLPENVTLDETYVAMHHENVEWAYDDA